MNNFDQSKGQGENESESIAEKVRAAFELATPVCIEAGSSKLLQGRVVEATALSVLGHHGITDHKASELVITARAGTPLAEIEAQLASAGQILPFEPPSLDTGAAKTATIGGTIACGLSGPRRPYAGAVRDAVLGVRIINGRGEIANFGGQVMKNVAGYDVSRLMVGAQGTLGVLLDVSIKVLPAPECEQSLCFSMSEVEALEHMSQWAGQSLPLSAAAYVPSMDETEKNGQLWLRLSGVESSVTSAVNKLGGEKPESGQSFWLDLREQKLAFFNQGHSIWRLSLPPAAPSLDVAGRCLIDWGGAQRWLLSSAPKEETQEAASDLGGSATLFDSQGAEFSPLSPGLEKIHRRIKKAFDPKGILNPGRLYPGL